MKCHLKLHVDITLHYIKSPLDTISTDTDRHWATANTMLECYDTAKNQYVYVCACVQQSALPADNARPVRASCSCAMPLPETGRPALPTRSQRPSSLGAISRDVLDVLFDEPDVPEGRLALHICVRMCSLYVLTTFLFYVFFAVKILRNLFHCIYFIL